MPAPKLTLVSNNGNSDDSNQSSASDSSSRNGSNGSNPSNQTSHTNHTRLTGYTSVYNRTTKTSLLRNERNIRNLFQYYCGRSEVPEEYFKWAFISMIAAAVEDRVYVEKLPGSKMAPNLYTFLIGASGSGKGVAIKAATKFLNDTKVEPYNAKITAQSVIDRLCKPYKNHAGEIIAENSKMYLVTPELSLSISSGRLADELIKLMTQLYEENEYIDEATRMHGNNLIQSACCNWLAGTNKVWLKSCVTQAAVEGGFFARSAVAQGEFNPALRIRRPEVPSDRERVGIYIKKRVDELTTLKGKFLMTPEAEELEEQWYSSRTEPSDVALMPVWRREQDLVLKVAMVFSMCDNTDLIMRRKHLAEAIRVSRFTLPAVKDLIAYTAITHDTRGLDEAEKIIARSGDLGIKQSTLARKLAGRGIAGDQYKVILNTLKEMKTVETIKLSNHATAIRKRRSNKAFLEVAESDDGYSESNEINPPTPTVDGETPNQSLADRHDES